MEYIEGQTLRDKVTKEPLGTDEALEIAIQIGEGWRRPITKM